MFQMQQTFTLKLNTCFFMLSQDRLFYWIVPTMFCQQNKKWGRELKYYLCTALKNIFISSQSQKA